MKRILLYCGVLLAAILLLAHPAAVYGQGPPDHAKSGKAIPGQYIVVLEPEASKPDFLFYHGLAPFHRYSVVNGLAVRMSAEKAQAVAIDPRVKYVVPDVTVSIFAPPEGKGKKPKDPPAQPTPEVWPTGVRRIFADQNITDPLKIAEIKVAIIDTGIQKDHPDLDVAGGINYTPGPPKKYADGHGHGTHVAGIVGAIKNNGIGVVGVAAGAQLYGVKVLGDDGSGSLSGVIAGVDWAAANGMDVANMSLGAQWWYADDPLCDAIDSAVAAGVTMVVAAGNMADYADVYTPAHCEKAITVSAIADYNGLPGGLEPPTTAYGADDTFATFSNLGWLVDIAAPGVDIYSTFKGSDYETMSGTSMASPHVAGAAALYIANNPTAIPEEVAAALVASGFPQADDPDNPSPDGFSKDPDRDLCAFGKELGEFDPGFAAMSCGAYEPLVNAGGL